MKRLQKKSTLTLLVLMLMLSLSSCGSNSNNTSTSSKTENETTSNEQTSIEETPSETQVVKEDNEGNSALEENADLVNYQTLAPVDGDTIVTITFKDYGDVKLKMFPKEAPLAVENFVTHAKEGYYDGLTMHRVIKDFMIQGGDPSGNGTGGESIWGKEFEDEIVEYLNPIRGALCMANAGPNTNGSQFYIVQASAIDESYLSGLTDIQQEMYRNHAGCPWLTGGYTVFGQVYEGMDVVDTIAKVKTDASTDQPLDSVIIEKITVEE